MVLNIKNSAGDIYRMSIGISIGLILQKYPSREIV
jgi:hypothetical protein